MLNANILDYIDRQLRSIATTENKHLPFGGKCVLIGGDWKQLPPVIKKSTWVDQVNASVKFSEQFKLFETLT